MEPNNDYIIVETIKSFLGTPKTEYDALNKKQWQFNCPTPKCRHDIDKFNLEYNSEKHQFKCWKCNYKGFVYRLAQDYGSKDDLIRIKSFLPFEKTSTLRNSEQNKPKVDHNLVTCKLPEEYLYQVQGQLWITGNQWCDFVSHDPELPAGLDLFIKRI